MAFMRLLKPLVALAAAASLVAACASGPSALQYPAGKTLSITKDVWDYYQEYLAVQGGYRKDGAFLVALVGDVGVSAQYSYCPPQYDACTFGAGAVNWANKGCIEKNLKCVVFARGSKIVVPYKILD